MTTLLADAPIGSHFAQFHRDVGALTDAVTAFLEAGLRRRNSVIVIATPVHSELFLERLAAKRLEQERVEVLDAEAVLGQFMRDGMPDWEDFRRTMAEVLERAQPAGEGQATRIYGELANLLWQRAQRPGAIRLEEFWTALGRLYPFSLYCAYTLDTHCEDCYAAPLEEIGRTHADILGTEDDDRFGAALDAASKDIFGIALSQMAGFIGHESERRFPSGQRTMLWVKRNLPSSTAVLAERARHYFKETRPPR